MAGSSLLVLIDDIATLLDDVSILAKVAAKKTAGVLGDDLALNAEQVSGVNADRELPVVWAVAKGSFKNKFILVPAALLISAVAPWLITPMLMVGGAFLCYEGFEKIAHTLLHSKEEDAAQHTKTLEAISDPTVDLVEFEKDKIKGAIRTDFILSAEIIVISLGVVKDAPFPTQVLVVSIMALLITTIVYGIVAAIVKLDDAGLYLLKTEAKNLMGGLKRTIGKAILKVAPYLMKTLSIVGTAAMFLVGGGIILHGLPFTHDAMHHATEYAQAIPDVGKFAAAITPTLMNAVAGIFFGGVVLVVVNATKSLINQFR
ncbi:MAG: DUF808 domain-containing protein [Gammaproteobacteria bacterium]